MARLKLIPEKVIIRSVLIRLQMWEMKGVVIHADRYNAGFLHYGGKYGLHIKMAKAGTPDITAYIKHKNICAICFFECKSSIGCQSDNQIKFMMKFKDLNNVYYDIVKDPAQIDERIESITGYSQSVLNSMN